MTEREIRTASASVRQAWIAGLVGLLANGTAMLVLAGVHSRSAGTSPLLRWLPFLAQEPLGMWWLWGWFAFFLFLSLIEISMMALALRAMARSSARRPLLLTVVAFVFFPAVYAWLNWLFNISLVHSLIIAAGGLLRLLIAHFSIQ
ncbi:MAG: hypothetical protein H5T60_04890 [Anaerolineae bacterium]|nr:hypothetical protein [Anaerolineae bacterium]